MAKRGIAVSYETVREWCLNFGIAYVKRISFRRSPPGDRSYMDEVFLRIAGRIQYLWRALDRDSKVLDSLVQPRRDKRAAKRFFRKRIGGLHYVSRAIITDRLGSGATAKRELLILVEHRRDRSLNDRAENFRGSTLERERGMRGLKSPGHAQRFLSVLGMIASFFRRGWHLLAAANYREIMRRRLAEWRELACLQPAI